MERIRDLAAATVRKDQSYEREQGEVSDYRISCEAEINLASIWQ